MPPEEQSFLSWLVVGAGAAIAGAGAWLWGNTMGRIQRLEDGKVGRDEFGEFKKTMEVVRKEQKDSTHELRTSMQAMVNNLHTKIETNQRELMQAILKDRR